MMSHSLLTALRELSDTQMPLPGSGRTAERHMRLMAIGRQDLSLARVAEAHFDALAILAEAGREPVEGKLYGVWASEMPGSALQLSSRGDNLSINGTKMFCSGAGLVDRALVTVAQPEHHLIEVDLRAAAASVSVDISGWKSPAFLDTRTATVTFSNTEVPNEAVMGGVGWYLQRTGFWHGACGPASCWAGGAEGLMDYAVAHTRTDPHSLAHFAAMQADIWALRAFLRTAGDEIDREPENSVHAGMRALTVRHLVEHMCADVLARFARSLGPYPLAMNEEVIRRYHELELYLRQSHAERDLESLGRLLRESTQQERV